MYLFDLISTSVILEERGKRSQRQHISLFSRMGYFPQKFLQFYYTLDQPYEDLNPKKDIQLNMVWLLDMSIKLFWVLIILSHVLEGHLNPNSVVCIPKGEILKWGREARGGRRFRHNATWIGKRSSVFTSFDLMALENHGDY